MRIHILYLCIWVFFQPIHAQYHWDFEDSKDYPSDWIGDTADFVIRDGALHLVAPEEGYSDLYYPIRDLDSMKWSIEYEMNFAPSDLNYLELDLIRSDSTRYSGIRYTLHIGEKGTQDHLRLVKYEQDRVIWEKSSTDSILGRLSNSGRVTISYQQYQWIISFKAKANNTIYSLPPIPDTLHISSGFFGISAHYTKTRRDKFGFEDISIGGLPRDTISPRIRSVRAWDAHALEVIFDEKIDTNTLSIPSFRLLPANDISSATYSQKTVLIRLRDSMPAGTQAVLFAYGIRDLTANETRVDSLAFEYIYTGELHPYDVIFNEIMFDPTPQVGLPDAEYIELYNRSDKYLELSELYLSDDGHTVELPDDTIAPHSYLILTGPKDSIALAPFGKTLGVKGFPGLQNDGENLRLTDYLAQLIDQITYSPKMHVLDGKRAGGWSVELSHPSHVCTGAPAWKSASNLIGGTPGKPNSISAKPPFILGPKLDFIRVEDAYSLHLQFDQKLHWITDQSNDDFYVSDGLKISHLGLDSYDPSRINITLDAPILPGISYELAIKSPIHNCISKPSKVPLIASFASAVRPDSGELLINELLFNPPPDGTDFIELINHSDKVLDLSTLRLGNLSSKDTILRKLNLDMPLYPGEVIALTKNPEWLRNTYTPPDSANIRYAVLPPMNDENGHLVLLSISLGHALLLDEIRYTEQMHDKTYTRVEGVSLERIDPDLPSADNFNWQSGVPANHYATPGYLNAAHVLTIKKKKIDAQVWLERSTFTPDIPGVDGKALLRYRIKGSSARLACSVYGIDGRLVKIIHRTEPIGHHGFMTWDGTDFDNIPCVTGVYIILAEVFEPEVGGNTYKLPVLLKRNNGR